MKHEDENICFGDFCLKSYEREKRAALIGVALNVSAGRFQCFGDVYFSSLPF